MQIRKLTLCKLDSVRVRTRSDRVSASLATVAARDSNPVVLICARALASISSISIGSTGVADARQRRGPLLLAAMVIFIGAADDDAVVANGPDVMVVMVRQLPPRSIPSCCLILAAAAFMTLDSGFRLAAAHPRLQLDAQL
ncbi:hypothetical protein QAD02_012452 [Eretmocerus hayati]|uniref:Uncharacterized protein n=1 Tax=Eretmocerus hayati TaxID=131215 RepID=A0ACC2P4H9_9HYME|nr:hypothetical protein QAD02_012452 [Eretmocerus hayati]